MLGVEKEEYAEALFSVLANANPSLTSLTLSHEQVALVGFERIRDALTINPNFLDIVPIPGKSWLPNYKIFPFVDHETLVRIQPIYMELTQFEQGTREPQPSSSSSVVIPSRDAVIERMNNYQFIYRSVCESILNQLPEEDQNRIHLNIWLLSGQPDIPNFGQENVFTYWPTFHRSVEAAGLKDRFEVLFS